MTLVFIDPHCSGLQVSKCKTVKDIPKVLAKAGMSEDQCSGEQVYYVFTDAEGKVTQGSLDFT